MRRGKENIKGTEMAMSHQQEKKGRDKKEKYWFFF